MGYIMFTKQIPAMTLHFYAFFPPIDDLVT